VRTTINLPEDLHAQLAFIARDTRQTLSGVTVRLLRRGLGLEQRARVYTDPSTGRVLLDLPRAVTQEDVRSLEDEE
jgi:hypothetical protein